MQFKTLDQFGRRTASARKPVLAVAALAAALSSQATQAVLDPQTYTFDSIDPNGGNIWTYDVSQVTGLSTGTITFNDWGYTGPTGVSVNDFTVDGGFDLAKLGQIQSVTTIAPDYLTSDPTYDPKTDKFGGNYTMPGANMDGAVNFNAWGYTTPTSYFNNMQIDTAGNYLVPKDDMQFGFYDTFTYNNNTDPTTDWDTAINFQPYATSDGIGWCGSTMVTNPNGEVSMAGQITFDFAFDAYLFDAVPGAEDPAPQLVPGFVMRSYGDYTVDVTYTPASREMDFSGHAVGNNMNPESIVPGVGGTIDPDFHNQVSFLGAGMVPDGVWVTADSYNPDGTRALNPDGTWAVTMVPEGTADAILHNNDFGGYAFLLRADANRTLEWISPDGHSDYVATDPAAYASIAAVPVPAAVWLFGSGLVALIGCARRRKIVC